MPDSRVKQFYDPNHVVAGRLKEIAAKKPPHSEPNCCVRNGFYWDEAMLYRPQARWKDDASSEYWNGPVVRIVADLERILNNQN
jgi:hypothetical protein